MTIARINAIALTLCLGLYLLFKSFLGLGLGFLFLQYMFSLFLSSLVIWKVHVLVFIVVVVFSSITFIFLMLKAYIFLKQYMLIYLSLPKASLSVPRKCIDVSGVADAWS